MLNMKEYTEKNGNRVPHKCPVCGKYTFDSWNSYDVCTVYGWEDYSSQELYPDDDLGPNYMSLNEYKAKFNSGWKPDWLDEAAEKAGGYTSFVPAENIQYNYREIIKYCKEKGIEPIDMTIRELNKFIIEDS